MVGKEGPSMSPIGSSKIVDSFLDCRNFQIDLHAIYVLHVLYVYWKDAMKRNLTISLDQTTIRKAKIVAARKDTSISGLVAGQIEKLVGEEEAYERAERQALAMLDEPFHLGGVIRVNRDELHER
jgi:hypothetical protein